MAEDFNPSQEYEQKGYLNCDFRLFHLDESKELNTPWHYHDFDKIVFFLRGNAKYAVEGREYDLKPYDIILVPHHNIHKAIAASTENYERYVLYLKPETLDGLEETKEGCSGKLKLCFNLPLEKKTNLVHFDAAVTAALLQDFQDLAQLLDRKKELYAPGLQVHISLLKLLIRINEACDTQPDAFLEKARYNRKVIDIIDYINGHLGDDLSIDQVADRFFISKYHMMRVFKAETGYSVHQYIMEKRILKARDLIIGGQPAMTASLESGFRDYSSFCKAFQKQTGRLPSDYTSGE